MKEDYHGISVHSPDDCELFAASTLYISVDWKVFAHCRPSNKVWHLY